MAKPTTNRKPADELGDVREEIKALQAREGKLRQQMINGEVELDGDDYRVSVTVSKREKIDEAKLKQELGMQFLRPFLREVETTTVYSKLKVRRV